jgi:host factor-I protein
MENKTPSQNIQDVYLNTVRRDKAPVTVFLISGVKLIGKIKGFDKYSVILEANNQEQLIFKRSRGHWPGWHRRHRHRPAATTATTEHS